MKEGMTREQSIRLQAAFQNLADAESKVRLMSAFSHPTAHLRFEGLIFEIPMRHLKASAATALRLARKQVIEAGGVV